MSELFHKSCYTSRSTGYKYRTLSTNTGEKKRRGSKDDTIFDRKFKDLKNAITSRILNEVIEAQSARKSIQEKFAKVETKINTMLEIQNTITDLRKDLRIAENKLVDMMEQVEKIENFVAISEAGSLKSRKSSFCKPRPNFESKDAFNDNETLLKITSITTDNR